MRFASNQELYDFIDRVSGDMKRSGFETEAQRLYSLIHETSWTTSSELLGELRGALRDIISKNKHKFDRSLAADTKACLKAIEKL